MLFHTQVSSQVQYFSAELINKQRKSPKNALGFDSVSYGLKKKEL